MTRQGPPLERLTRRLAECPTDMTAAPRTRSGDGIHVDAVVFDVASALGGPPPARTALTPFGPKRTLKPRALELVLIACWLLADDAIQALQPGAARAVEWLATRLAPLSEIVPPKSFVDDQDRREEFVRLCLAALGLLPAGETDALADDRLRTLDSVERVRLLRDTREQEARARKLREAMRQKEAAEAAAKVSREW
jgi:hypothetical protein